MKSRFRSNIDGNTSLHARVVRVLERVCQAELTHQEEQETTAEQTAQAVVEDSSLDMQIILICIDLYATVL